MGDAVVTRARELRSEAVALQAQAALHRWHAEHATRKLSETLLRLSGPPLGDQGDRFMLRLGRLPSLVRLARQDLGRWLERQGVGHEVTEEIALACSEACANAVEHPKHPARQRFEVEARRRDGAIELCVRDFGGWDRHSRSELRGRGLQLIRTLMDSVEVLQRPEGTQLLMRRSVSR